MCFYQLITQLTSSAPAGLHAGLICSTPQHNDDAGRGRVCGTFEADPVIRKQILCQVFKVHRMPLLWTPELSRDFHGAVETLRSITENPSEEKDYRNSLPDIPSSHYTFRLKDELKLADHVAFLAHSQEGVFAISAACVEESKNGLVIRLASNSTPSEKAVSGLTKILNTFSDGARDGKAWFNHNFEPQRS